MKFPIKTYLIPNFLLCSNSDNKWHCDCRLSWLRDWVTNNNWRRLKYSPQCSEPEAFNTLTQLTDLDLRVWLGKCDPVCECTCEVDDDLEYHVKVDCSNRGLPEVSK